MEQMQISGDVFEYGRWKCRRSQGTNGLLLLIVLIAAICFLIAAWAFSSVAPEPYMDEVFHVPQTQAYCMGNYGLWDPKITTPPGLYIFGVAYAQLMRFSTSVFPTPGSRLGGQECEAVVLRNVNWGFSIGTLCVMRSILARRMRPGKAFAHAALLWLYPVSFFFSFLYYTDPGATFFVLLCYLLSMGPPRGGTWWRRSGSALAGGAAVFFRQTNAVWVAFTLAVCLLEDFAPLVIRDGAPDGADSRRKGDGADRPPGSESWERIDGASPLRTDYSNTPLGSGSAGDSASSIALSSHSSSAASLSRRRKAASSGGARTGVGGGGGGVISDVCSSKSCGERLRKRAGEDEDRALVEAPFLPPLPTLLLRLIRAALADACRGVPLLRCRAPLAVPVVLFVVAVWGFNGGVIVLGDKENHSPGGPPHLAQFAYLSAVGASLWGLAGREAAVAADARKGFFLWVVNRGFVTTAAIVGAVALALRRYSLAHPFLVSDNRHYSFYVWQRLLSSPAARSALAPAYVFCGWLMMSRLLERKTSLWVVTFAGAAALVLVPSPLLEPRYLTIPVLLAHLESRERSWGSLLGGVAACAAVNLVTIFTFLYRPFAWHDGSVARFMW